MNELALFAGAGGGILGGQLLGWRTVCAVELDAYAAAVLAQRQNDGLLHPFPVWSDITTFNGYPWQGIVDVVSGGFPCQDISAAGKGVGITGERSGLWKEFKRIICEVRPQFVYVENSPVLTSRGLHVVLGDLAAMGYDAEWGVLGAADVGAPHQRDRIWIVGYVANSGCKHGIGRPYQQKPARRKTTIRGQAIDNAKRCGEVVADSNQKRQQRGTRVSRSSRRRELKNGSVLSNSPGVMSRYGIIDDVPPLRDRQEKGSACRAIQSREWWATEPDVGRVAYGVAHRVDRLKAIGNGQVPLCEAEAFVRLSSRAKY